MNFLRRIFSKPEKEEEHTLEDLQRMWDKGTPVDVLRVTPGDKHVPGGDVTWR